ncbi:hypothetical protein BDW68DRAFT_158159 [Aspergillus falconensis]
MLFDRLRLERQRTLRLCLGLSAVPLLLWSMSIVGLHRLFSKTKVLRYIPPPCW